jgi:tripartite-type tricarboxylate transporter receptor subunit TctC
MHGFGRRNVFALLAPLGLIPWPALTQPSQDFPIRTIRIVVPFTPGSASDILARRIAPRMNENWGQPVVVENRPGAGTTLGAGIVAKAAPDGYTLLINSAAFAASAAIYTSLTYDATKDFAPISQLAAAPIVLVAAPSLEVRSIKNLVERARQKPGQVTFGSAGIGSSTHFAGEQFKLSADIDVVHVPYKGPAEALLDVMAGRVQYALSPLVPALPFIKDGRLIALGVTTATRSLALPDVPTIAEGGVQSFEYEDWWGVFAPARTPAAILARISREVARILELPDVKGQFLSQGEEPRPSTPDAFSKFLEGKIGTARKVAALAKIKVE